MGLSISAIASPNGDPVHGWLGFSLPVALCVSAPLREVFTAWIRLSRDLACDRPTSPKAHLDIAPTGTGWRRPRRPSQNHSHGDEDIASPFQFPCSRNLAQRGRAAESDRKSVAIPMPITTRTARAADRVPRQSAPKRAGVVPLGMLLGSDSDAGPPACAPYPGGISADTGSRSAPRVHVEKGSNPGGVEGSAAFAPRWGNGP